MQCLQKSKFSCAQLLYKYEEKIEIQNTEMYNAQRTPVKQIAWNMLHEIWNICMMQQINIFQWNSTHYETRNICFLKYISWNLLIVSCKEMLRMLLCFSSIQMERLQQITWNIFPSCALHCKYYACNIFYETCFMQYVSQVRLI